MNKQDNMNPLISVILTTYNRDSVLRYTIESILTQTLSDYELIISDDYSSDSTEKICKEYELQDKRIRYFRQPINLKMPANLNFGIKQARANYIANLFDGDYYREDLLEKWYRCLSKYSNAGFVFNEYQAIDRYGNVIRHYKEYLPEVINGKDFLKKISFRRWQFDSPVWGTVMGKKSAYEKVGLFDERFGIFADVDMWMKLACNFDVAYVNEPLIKLPTRDVLPSYTNQLSHIEQMKIADEMFFENRKRLYFNNCIMLFREITKHYIFRALKGLYNGAACVKRGQVRMAFAFLKAGLGYYR